MFEPNDVNGNAADPLKPARSDHGRELFEQITLAASGFSYEDVVNAATNLIVNAVRQSCDNRRTAEGAFDEIVARTKALLLEQHYDAGTGKRKSVFPHHQIISMPMLDAKSGSIRGR